MDFTYQPVERYRAIMALLFIRYLGVTKPLLLILLLNNKTLTIAKLKIFANDKFNLAKMMVFVSNRVAKIVGREENALSPTMNSKAYCFSVVKTWDCAVKEFNLARGPWWPWIAHLSHFPHKWILYLCSFGSNLWSPVLIPKVYTLSLQVLEKKNFKVGPLCSYVPTCDPRGGVSFDPKGNMNKLIKVHKEMLNTKYQSSNPSSFREEKFWSWFSLFPCSNLWHPGQGQFWSYKHHINKLSRGPW